MHAYLLISRDEKEIEENIKSILKKESAKRIDYTLEKIEDARELKKLTKFSFGEKTAIVIHDIDRATIEALNAFLKSLEEPSPNVLYILTSKNLEGVLPTITSRCEVIKLSPNNEEVVDDENYELVSDFLSSNIDKRFEIILNIKDREVAIKFIEELIMVERKAKNYEFMEDYLKTIKALKMNGNVSLHLTNLVVTMNRD